ncbi:MAG: hypothetical protein EBU40_12340 [Proteobacteria bacterium]|nr:hypothetical protein [Pseudomonadota bacterium]
MCKGLVEAFLRLQDVMVTECFGVLVNRVSNLRPDLATHPSPVGAGIIELTEAVGGEMCVDGRGFGGRLGDSRGC